MRNRYAFCIITATSTKPPEITTSSTAHANQTPQRSYRCHYNPLDGFGNPILSESGLLPFVQVKAATAEHAMRAALATIRGAVSHVERIEDAATATPGARQ